MIDFLAVLIGRYRSEIKNREGGASVTDVSGLPDIKKSLSSLIIAESALKKISLCEKFPHHPGQVVIIGPTQVGKSTMVNLLLQRELAVANAVAGFTVHCQGYVGVDADHDLWSEAYFSGLAPRNQTALDRQVLDEYSLTSSEDSEILNERFGGTVFWDTPDFDSVDSFGYRVPVLKAIALADLIVFVVSRDKYADKTVWDMLSLLSGLAKPTLIVMNKTPPDYRMELAESVANKIERLNIDTAQGPSNGLFFIDEYKAGPAAAADTQELEDIRLAIESSLKREEPAKLQQDVTQFMSSHWADWTASVVDEHRLQSEWKTLVDDVAAKLVKRYRTEYLNDTRDKETFQLALAELLALLEVPGMAEPLSKIRSVVTWPMRKLIEKATDVSSNTEVVKDDRSEERRLLEALGDHGLSQLAVRTAAKQQDRQWWESLHDKLESDKSRLLDGYHTGLDNYQALLQVEIERAAQSLYNSLEKQPATLNGLRAARVTADAAAVVLAVKSGGLGAADLVIAPAMLSLTSMLTEGALGQYMQKVQNDLRVYQEKEVTAMIGRKLRVRLYPLASESGSIQKVSQSQLQRASNLIGVELPAVAPSVVDQNSSAGINDV